MSIVRALPVALAVLFVSQFCAAAVSDGPSGGAVGEAVSVSVVESDMNRLTLRIDVPDMRLEDVVTPDGTFSRVTIPGCGPTATVGEALLPVVREFIEVPYGAAPSVTLVSADYRTVSLSSLGTARELVPVQAPVAKVPGALEAAPFARSADYYARDAFTPDDVVRLGDTGTMRGHRFAQLEVHPVRYNPVRKEVSYATRIEVRVEFPGADPSETRRVLDRLSNAYTEQVAGDTFINHAAFAARYDVPLPIGYLIVCYDSFTDEIAPLASWKSQKGYNVTVVSTADIPGGNTKENIKAYIQDAYDNWAVPPTFVLLVGDTPQISHWVGTQTDNPSTDLYYVTMDGSSDWQPDIWIGRFSCTTGAQVTNLVDKTVDYERWNLTSGTSWVKKAVFMASSDNHTVPEATHEYVIREYLDPLGYYSERLYSYSGATTQQVRDAFNDGRSLGIYSGHGDVTYWADGPVFTASDVNNLTNTDMLPLVHSYSCLTGQFSSSCFGETWTNAVDKGAVVFWGSSVYSYWDEDDVLERGAFKAMFSEGYAWACGISHRALYWVYDHYSGGGSTHRYYEMYNILGDPSLDVWTDVPSTLDAAYAGTLPVGATAFDITVTADGSPVDHALVCVAKDDDGVYEAAYTDASGQASIALDPAPVTPGAMAVTVTKHDCYPHEGSTTVSLSDSPYIVYESHLIDDDMTGDSVGDGDGVADAGEYIELVVTLENIGNQTGTDITATISESEPDVLVSDSYEEYGTIVVGGTAQCLEDYDIYIAPGCPDGYVAQLIIEATDGDSTWTSVCSIPVSAPVLEVSDYVVDDGPGFGNGNGCVEPGESASVSVVLGNSGGDDASGVSVEMMSSDPYVTVTAGTSGAGLVPSGGSAMLSPVFEIAVAPGAPSFHEATLELHITTAGGYSNDSETVAVLIGGGSLEEDFEVTGTDWAHYNVTNGFADQWHIETYRYHSAGHSWKFGGSGSGGYGNSSDGALETPTMCVGSDAVFSFWSWLAAEEESATSAWDCALVEVSSDDGASWSVLTPDGGYSHTKNSNPDNPLPEGTPCWSGSHDWREETFDLAAYEGQRVIIRFRFVSDGYVTEEGWYVDDVRLASTGTGVAGGEEPLRYALMQNSPNPFNPLTTIRYSLPERSRVTIRVFDVAGRLVATLADRVEDAGEGAVVWDGTNERGQDLGSGVYFCAMTAGDFSDRKVMVLLK